MQRLAMSLLMMLPALAHAQAMPGIGNMPPDFYPRSPCAKPNKNAIGTPDFSDGGQAGYNTRVRAFNAQANAFNACIKDYVDKAQADIAQIQAVVQAVVADANRP